MDISSELQKGLVRVHEPSAENETRIISDFWKETGLTETSKHTQVIRLWLFYTVHTNIDTNSWPSESVSLEQDNSFCVHWHSEALSFSTNTLWRISDINLELLGICGHDVTAIYPQKRSHIEVWTEPEKLVAVSSLHSLTLPSSYMLIQIHTFPLAAVMEYQHNPIKILAWHKYVFFPPLKIHFKNRNVNLSTLFKKVQSLHKNDHNVEEQELVCFFLIIALISKNHSTDRLLKPCLHFSDK